MRSRSVTAAIVISVLCAGGAVGSYLQSRALRTDAQWLMARGEAQAQEYASTFDNAAAEKQLGTFEARRVVLAKAQRWQLLQMILVMAAVIAAFSSYVLFLFRRLREQLIDADSGHDHYGDLHGPSGGGSDRTAKAFAAL